MYCFLCEEVLEHKNGGTLDSYYAPRTTLLEGGFLGKPSGLTTAMKSATTKCGVKMLVRALLEALELAPVKNALMHLLVHFVKYLMQVSDSADVL